MQTVGEYEVSVLRENLVTVYGTFSSDRAMERLVELLARNPVHNATHDDECSFGWIRVLRSDLKQVLVEDADLSGVLPSDAWTGYDAFMAIWGSEETRGLSDMLQSAELTGGKPLEVLQQYVKNHLESSLRRGDALQINCYLLLKN